VEDRPGRKSQRTLRHTPKGGQHMRWMTGASKEPPHRRLWGPLGKGGALCNRRSTAVPIRPPRPSSITHPEVALATVTCIYIATVTCSYRLAQVDSWLGQQHNMTTTKRSAVGNAWAGWGSIPVFFPPGWQVTRVSPYVRGPFPSKEIRRISERDDLSPPVVPGGWGSRTLKRAGR